MGSNVQILNLPHREYPEWNWNNYCSCF